MTSIELTAPAKVNLLLEVLNKRKDSYRNILTLFERISLKDRIKISKIPKGIIIKSDRFITHNPKDNIAYKAAELILSHKKVRGGVNINIIKRIPLASGLGGGSSDAASVLKGINILYGLNYKTKDLMHFASQIGSDVPFFILDMPFAIGRLKGDKLKIIGQKASFWHLLIYPGFGISTKEVYESFNASVPKHLTKNPEGAKIRFPFKRSLNFSLAEDMLHNDLEKTVIAKKSVISGIIERLALSLGKKAIVSGSGPSVFCLYKTGKEALRAKKRFLKSVPVRERKGWQVFVTRTLD